MRRDEGPVARIYGDAGPALTVWLDMDVEREVQFLNKSECSKSLL